MDHTLYKLMSGDPDDLPKGLDFQNPDWQRKLIVLLEAIIDLKEGTLSDLKGGSF